MADSPFIFEADAQSFPQVIQTSHQVPVLVDFWADWCQPCQALTPTLEKLANEYQGAFVLVKVNADANQSLLVEHGVRGLPTVKMFKDGQAVDEVTGALPEAEIRKFIDKHRTRPTEPYRQQALAMQQAGELDNAIQLMQQVIQHEPDFYEAALELALMQMEKGEVDQAETLLQSIPEGEAPAEQLQKLQAEIKMARLQEQAADVDTSALEQRLADNPDDLDAMLELAKARVAQGKVEEGLELYLTVMKKDSGYEDGAGRAGLLSTFEVLGPGHALVKKYRGKMFSLLY